MKKMAYQNVKGTKDYLPSAEIIRRDIKRTLEDVFIKYGCKPLETPILNYSELLASKYGGGAEILEEMYTLSDRGARGLALRYDLTIPFAKVVALNPTLRMPMKRYEIGKVFRDGPIKTGRLREFTQCDVDIVGVESQLAEAELIIMALDAFRQLDLDIIIQYNNRKLLTGILEVFQTEEKKINKVVMILDKLEKVGLDNVINELDELGLSKLTIKSIKQFITANNNTSYSYFQSLSEQNERVKQGLNELQELENYLELLDASERCEFNPFLARGLEIYTGTIYEVFLADLSLKSSIGSGGRYDNAIGGLIGTNEKYSTVGISFGLDAIYTATSVSKELTNKTDIDYYLIPINTERECLLVAHYLRNQGNKVEMEMSNKKLGKALVKANKEKIPYVIIVGEDEVKKNQLKIKNMFSGEEKFEPFQFNS
ncbi:histidine--tRNA ligase [Cytobacillus sp. IB215665]|uniref:histidine--tRNA ligase n=1 Tax=Cytobacillus sp. IB215665 TaxID=3097357 RepID=UPI002A13A554|nr:histidine--tRNA ligase [Cytobacillus sp. IB215665]MDX8366754.1 histidine--tRNA ligase [Cytobacillus sp. IB215665]